jgi:tRNA(Arg) A34 adenosine deaminase TadA
LEYTHTPFNELNDFFKHQINQTEELEFIEILGPLSGPFLKDEQALNLDLEIQNQLSRPVNKLEDALELLEKLSLQIPRGTILHDYHRPITALIVDHKNQILSYGLHSGSQNKTLHAEVNALQKLFNETQKGIPTGSKIYVSHKPCKMCAAMIWRMAEDIKNCRIYFRDVELGGLSKTTILDENSAERKSFSLPELQTLKIQFQFSEMTSKDENLTNLFEDSNLHFPK